MTSEAKDGDCPNGCGWCGYDCPKAVNAEPADALEAKIAATIAFAAKDRARRSVREGNSG